MTSIIPTCPTTNIAAKRYHRYIVSLHMPYSLVIRGIFTIALNPGVSTWAPTTRQPSRLRTLCPKLRS